MKILGLCGSLRKESRSLVLLEATKILAADNFEFSIFNGAGNLPFFNPDIEASPPAAVRTLWRAVDNADAIIISSPEYAHGVTGVLKNTLDWLVGYIPFANKPVAVFNPSHRAQHADAALKEILTTMAVQLISAACLRIPVTACGLNALELSRDEECAPLIHSVLAAVAMCCRDN